MIRPLFIVGNKRSGTSLFVHILNLHPNIFVSHESDVVWILYQFGRGEPYRSHPWDSAKGMRLTLADCGQLVRHGRSPWENFLDVERALMEHGTPWLPPMQKPDLAWIGDKKPFQHTDPQLLAFIFDHLPEARFLHIVRHPCSVAHSSDRYNEGPDGDFWIGLSPEEKIERWAFHEAQVEKLRRVVPERVHSLRYEDLCRWTERELSQVFRFLELAPNPVVLKAAARLTLVPARAFPAISCSAEAQRLAQHYGYDVKRSKSARVARSESWLWGGVKRAQNYFRDKR